MSRPQVLPSSFHHYAQPAFDILPPGVSHRPLSPTRAPELPAGYHQQHTGHHGRTATLRMAGPGYMSDEELVQFQKLSNDYSADQTATGPYVGERQSSSAIATEYANADRVYQIKTAALPSQYAYFRTCRGDGHCGWRALAFTYYEALLRVGDGAKCEEEEARLQSMHNLLNQVGFQEHVYIDFAEEAYILLQKLAQSLRNMDGNGESILLETFNDYGTAMAIITFFKLLASAWMQCHPNDFQPFLEFPLKTYCSDNIEASQAELDHLAIGAISNAVTKPAGFAIHVLYLDRSEGTSIDTHRFEPVDQNGMTITNGITMRLLYRPGHYDILYKAEDVPAPIQQQPGPAPAPLQVALAAGYADEFVPRSNNMSDIMTMIPGLSYTALSQQWPSVSYDYDPSPAPQPQLQPVPTYAPAPTPTASVATSHQEYVTPVHASHVGHSQSHHTLRLETPISLPIHSSRPPPPMAVDRPPPPVTIEKGGPFRPSMYELEPGFGTGRLHHLPFQTSIFRNSHYNTAHYLNPDFQPEEWSPDSEYATGNRGRLKSSSQ